MKKLLICLIGADILDAFLSYPKRELGAEVAIYANDDQLRISIEDKQPDVVLLDMAAGGSTLPRPDTLRWIRKRCRLVQVCFDASDIGWVPYLAALNLRLDATDLCIAADGAVDWPYRERDVSFPTPVDPGWYPDRIEYRSVKLGFSGSCGSNPSPRKAVLDALGDLVTVRQRTPTSTYADHAAFYRGCWAVVNDAHTSNGQLQCKARVIEAALAGCLIFETKGSPTRNWLQEGVDYFEYDSPEFIKAACADHRFEHVCGTMGANARKKVLGLKLPERFWGTVLG